MDESRRFLEIGEPYASGFYEAPARSEFYRFARAQRRFWECAPLSPYDGGALFPCGKKYPDGVCVVPDFSFTFALRAGLAEKWPEGAALMERERDRLRFADTPHTVGGAGYTHSIPNYGRVLKEGLASYEARVRALPAGDFRDGLLEILAGIAAYQTRAIAHCRAAGAPRELLKALEWVPYHPARSLYEALVAWNFLYYIDGCDNPGRLDADLFPYYRGEDAEPWLREFFLHVDVNDGWSAAIGPDCNPLTLQCLRAIRGLRRPSLELRLREDAPEEIWTAAIEALAGGCGSPSLYNETLYQSALAERFPEMPAADRFRFNGGGCTETMLAGISNVGSLDAGINLPLVFAAYMRENLADTADFAAFYDGFLARARAVILETLAHVNEFRQTRAQVRPQPVRTLLIDDCIARGRDFNAGGARYYWSVVNVAGLVNVIDSLLAIRALVYEDKSYAPGDFLALLSAREPMFLARARRAPCFGVGDLAADQLAAAFTQAIFAVFEETTPYLGGKFLPSSIQFVTYTEAGKPVPATPDGRGDGAPLADSLGAVHGKDVQGPTALLESVARLPLRTAVGTPVVNIRLQKRFLFSQLKPLALAFFRQGGMQLQISCLSRAEMEDALIHPAAHENLIVRVGGYAEYFNRLSPDLQQTVLARTEFA